MGGSRREYLSVLGVVATGMAAGCLGTRGPPEHCPAETITPIEYPERPETLTEESVSSFVAEVERAYMYRDYANDDYVYVGFDPTPDEVRQVDDGWEARIETSLSGYACDEGEMGHGDGAYTAYYYLNETSVYRIDNTKTESPDPRANGTKLPVGD
jgi:hypothetical protein